MFHLRGLFVRTKLMVSGLGILAIFVFIGTAEAIPISSCNAPDPLHQTCYLYPTASSNPAFDSGTTTLSYPVSPVLEDPTTPGFLVLLFPTIPNNLTNEATVADWDQVIEFVPNADVGTGSTEIMMFTNGCASGVLGDTSCFPSLATVQAGIAGTPTYYDNQCSSAGQTQGDGDVCAGAGVYFWYPDEGNLTQGHEYYIFDPGATASASLPEPTSIWLILIGFVGILAARARRTVLASR